MAGATPVGRGAHHDAPLTNLAIEAFQDTGDFIAQKLFPIVPVNKQSDKYYIIDPDEWLRVKTTLRAPKTAPRRIEFEVTSDSFFCDNYALAGENALEDLANADAALRLQNNTTRAVVDGLLLDYENRVASQVTSGANLGSYVSLSGTAKWSDYVNSNPVSDVTTAHAFIRSKTGLVANTMVMDKDTFAMVRRHPVLLDMFKYTSGGMATEDQIKSVFGVQNLLIPSGVKNNARRGATSSITNIWGNNVILARVVPGVSLKTATFGLSFRWRPAGIAAPMQVRRYTDPDPGKKVEIIEAGYYQDEKIVAKDLSYGILSAI